MKPNLRSMMMMACAAGGVLASTCGHAAIFSGTLYYTTFAGAPNVWNVNYSYDDSTHAFSLGSHNSVATLGGADGIIFGTNGNLLVGGQGPIVYEVNPNTGAVVNSQTVAGGGGPFISPSLRMATRSTPATSVVHCKPSACRLVAEARAQRSPVGITV